MNRRRGSREWPGWAAWRPDDAAPGGVPFGMPSADDRSPVRRPDLLSHGAWQGEWPAEWPQWRRPRGLSVLLLGVSAWAAYSLLRHARTSRAASASDLLAHTLDALDVLEPCPKRAFTAADDAASSWCAGASFGFRRESWHSARMQAPMAFVAQQSHDDERESALDQRLRSANASSPSRPASSDFTARVMARVSTASDDSNSVVIPAAYAAPAVQPARMSPGGGTARPLRERASMVCTTMLVALATALLGSAALGVAAPEVGLGVLGALTVALVGLLGALHVLSAAFATNQTPVLAVASVPALLAILAAGTHLLRPAFSGAGQHDLAAELADA